MLTDKGEISANQLAFLIFPTILATAILSVPGVAPAAWFSEYIVLAFLLPYVNKKKRTARAMVVSLVVTTKR